MIRRRRKKRRTLNGRRFDILVTASVSLLGGALIVSASYLTVTNLSQKIGVHTVTHHVEL